MFYKYKFENEIYDDWRDIADILVARNEIASFGQYIFNLCNNSKNEVKRMLNQWCKHYGEMQYSYEQSFTRYIEDIRTMMIEYNDKFDIEILED